MTKCSKYYFVVAALFLIGCSTHFTTLQQNDEKTLTIYQISEEEAFQLAHWAIVTTFPNYKITHISGPIRGYSTLFRIMLDKYSQQVLVIPTIGTKQNGEEIKGFYFEVSGSGSTVTGRQKNVELFELLNKALVDTGKGVIVTTIRLAKYETNLKILGEEAQQLQNTDKKSPTESLRDLKQLHKEGIISDEEFEIKKKEILQRM